MRKIVRSCFRKASRVIDRLHIRKLACDAVQEMRIMLRWNAIQEANDEMEEAKQKAFLDWLRFMYTLNDYRVSQHGSSGKTSANAAVI